MNNQFPPSFNQHPSTGSTEGTGVHCMRSIVVDLFRPSLKVHHSQCLTSMTKHDAGGSPPGAACDIMKPPHDKTQGSASSLRWRSRLSPYLPNGHFPRRPNYRRPGVPLLSPQNPFTQQPFTHRQDAHTTPLLQVHVSTHARD
jgi:hypothetical protein